MKFFRSSRISTNIKWYFCFLFLLILISQTLAEDIVHLNIDNSSASKKLKGTVVQHTGKILTLQTFAGSTLQVASDKVDHIIFEKLEAHQQADQFLKAKDYQKALIAYLEALSLEPRDWVKREILSQMCWCYQYQGNFAAAGECFLQIAKSDPDTFYLAQMPLAWTRQSVPLELERQAQLWLQNSQVKFARLLGASWLLNTQNRSQALAVLLEEERNPDQSLALLAEFQRRRTQLVTTTSMQLDIWQEQLTRLPKAAQAGPTLLLAQGRVRLDQYQQAIMLFMRLPILFPENRQLASFALLAAAQSLSELNRSIEATKVYQEIIVDFPNSSEAIAAKTAIELLTQPKR